MWVICPKLWDGCIWNGAYNAYIFNPHNAVSFEKWHYGNAEMVDQFSAVGPLSGIPNLHKWAYNSRSQSFSTKETGSSLVWRGSPHTPMAQYSGTKIPRELEFDSELSNFMEDDTPEILKDNSTLHNAVKVEMSVSSSWPATWVWIKLISRPSNWAKVHTQSCSLISTSDAMPWFQNYHSSWKWSSKWKWWQMTRSSFKVKREYLYLNQSQLLLVFS